jgi:hypothetical protein
MRAIAGSNVWVDQLFPVQPGQTYRQPFEEPRWWSQAPLLALAVTTERIVGADGAAGTGITDRTNRMLSQLRRTTS